MLNPLYVNVVFQLYDVFRFHSTVVIDVLVSSLSLYHP